jgi:glycosyltransferase involved in cell wall biosynthesis
LTDMIAKDLSLFARKFLATMQRRPRILYIVTEDWYFVSHRLGLAVAAIQAGFNVAIATRVSEHRDIITAAGIVIFPVDFNRSGLHPFQDLTVIRRLATIYRTYQPDISHHVALKPVLYGSLAARITGHTRVVNALAGLGYVFSSKTRRARILRGFVTPLLRVATEAPQSRLIVQNDEDRSRVIQLLLARPENVCLIPGAGVELGRYSQTDAGKTPPLVVLPARLLREKGVLEFVEAARILKSESNPARFALVGRPDPLNPASVSQVNVDDWVSEGVIEAWGWQEDIPAVLAQAQVVCLPSYHEGFPKSLLEAAASGCAMVATDIAGCRAIVLDGETGLLVPVGEVPALAAALRRMTTDIHLRQQCGANARQLARSSFSIERVINLTFAIYWEILSNGEA